ncbi:hypothetical protein EOD41_02560 [Mucilaginibacter limnophilus]|uniref:DUF5000 domain-containing protein n=1 Tax=Mucilaginibacter limnophilus TaxID=1932778 RepID=A0A3S2X0V4_9SPHI|nr:DUF4998 domain-containing protein [Mucilaginibacter limnophilus]RVU02836.1 hypothetical protein EOD41_02560 [Mucilaginibacter limnophilus]
MKNIKFIVLGLLTIAIYSCKKSETKFRDFFDGHEIVYPGAVSDVSFTSGHLRAELKWPSSPDPSITKYVVYWNNKADSQVVNITEKQDTIKTIVSGLQEYVYSFTIYAFDKDGNKSIPKEVNNVKVYGDLFTKSLSNRNYDVTNPYSIDKNGVLTLYFISPDTINVTNVGTTVRYTNQQGNIVEKNLPAGSNTLVITDYKAETAINYRSSYIPGRQSIDTFFVPEYSSFAQIDPYYAIDKSLFRSMSLPNEVYADFGTSFEKLWDGSIGPQSYPNIFHTNSVDMPHFFTFDLGQVYNGLGKMEETGRDCCHNPDQFEVWGIADINSSHTSLPGNNAGWKDEMIANGWTLLADITRNDDGSAPYKFNLISNPPPVRYIRIRVKHTANGNTVNSNISELTLWNKL